MDNFELVLVGGLVLLAVVNAASLVWAFYLDQKLRSRPTPKVYEVHIEGSRVFSEIDLAAVEQQAKGELQGATHEAAQKMQDTLKVAIGRIAEHVDEMTTTTLNQEFEKYQVSLQALREQSITEFTKLQAELNDRRQRMLEALEKQVTAEQAKRMEQFDSKLNDIVSSYIVESLGSQVDLGAQMVHILQNLQQNKDTIKKDLSA